MTAVPDAGTERPKRHVVQRGVGAGAGRVRFVPVVFGTDDPAAQLADAGFEPGAATLVLWDGVTNYPAPEAVDATLTFLAAVLGTGSPVVFTYVDRGIIDGIAVFEGGRYDTPRSTAGRRAVQLRIRSRAGGVLPGCAWLRSGVGHQGKRRSRAFVAGRQVPMRTGVLLRRRRGAALRWRR